MKNALWLIGLLTGFLACSKSADELEISPNGPKNATAILNDSTWYAHGTADKVSVVPGDACTINRFNLYLSNELPYPKGARPSAAYDCIGNCNTTQSLSFRQVPLAVGRYDIANLNACILSKLTAVSYILSIGGDAIFSFYQALDANSGWIEVTRADTNAKVVEGKFEFTLLSFDKTKTVRFRSGQFSARLSP